MQNRVLIEVENLLAESMLVEVITNNRIKQTLREIGDLMLIQFLQPMQEEVNKVNGFSELKEITQKWVTYIASEHALSGKQYGAITDQFKNKEEIINSKDNLNIFLNTAEEILTQEITNPEQLVKLIKLINDIGNGYFKELPELHTPEFVQIKKLIYPIEEEFDLRIQRTELLEEEQLAVTFGISAEKDDLAPKNKDLGRIAGKSVFGLLSMEKRFEILTRQYDETGCTEAEEKLNHYQIALKVEERLPLSKYAERKQTTFEKLAKLPDGSSLPLVASVSGSTARILAFLLYFGAFNKNDGLFDFDKAQHFTNCLMGFYIKAGHHSFLELAEVYNRLIDYVAISHPEQLPRDVIPESPSDVPYFDAYDQVEEKLPYHHIGSYGSLFHESYRNKVMNRVRVSEQGTPAIQSIIQPFRRL